MWQNIKSNPVLWVVIGILVIGFGLTTYFLIDANTGLRRDNRQIKAERNELEEKFKQSQIVIDSIENENIILALEKRKYLAFTDSMITSINNRSPRIVLIKNYEGNIVGSVDLMAKLRAWSNFLSEADSLSR